MTTTYDSRRVLDAGCPQCGADSGAPCRTQSGRRYNDFHIRRKGAVYPRFLQGSGGGTKRGIRKAGVQ
jgi:hypothetical protein